MSKERFCINCANFDEACENGGICEISLRFVGNRCFCGFYKDYPECVSLQKN